jgi:DNA-binding CsgD family transcriptional regulator
LAALQALKELTNELSLAGSGEEIGRALLATARRFGFTTGLVVDMTQLFTRLGPAIVFTALGRAPLELFDTHKPFAQHPFTRRAQASERPFVMSRVKAEHGAKDEEWWAGLPPHLRDTDGIVVPVHDNGRLAWYAGFAGREPDLSARTLSVMSAAVHAGYARFRELLSDKTPRSPLSPREAECLRWIAEGKTDVEAGKILHISPRTVRFHINNAKAKLGVATRIQAVAKRMSG